MRFCDASAEDLSNSAGPRWASKNKQPSVEKAFHLKVEESDRSTTELRVESATIFSKNWSRESALQRLN